jgi:hypothetical protein
MIGTRISGLLGNITVLVIVSCCNLPAQAKYGGGTGEPNDPYLIYDANQMNAIGADSNDWDKQFKLMSDIDLSGYTGTTFNIIGTSLDNAFTGIFDGNNHTFVNFTYNSNAINCIGLFRFVYGPNVQIKNLGLIDPNVDVEMGRYIGSLVGRLSGGTITNCYVEGGSVSGNRSVGGLVGYNGGKITNCYTAASVSGRNFIGGLVGENYGSGTITNCYSEASISGTGWNVGGLVGYNNYYGTITNCYSTGTVSGFADVGGLVGENGGWNGSGTITNCYSEASVSGDHIVGGLVGHNLCGIIINCYAEGGSVSGDHNIGGLVAWNQNGTITNCYSVASVSGTYDYVGGLVGWNTRGTISNSFWDVQTSGQASSDGGTGKTTAEMQDSNTFLVSGWDFVGELENGPNDDWAEPAGGGYPILCWQLPPFFGLPSFSGGSGTDDDPYLLSTAEDLNRISRNPRLMSSHFKLINDIDLTDIDFFVIANRAFPFTGVFDGNGHTISNFTCDSNDTNYVGLFGYVDEHNAQIKNLGLIDTNVDVGTGSYVGSLVGRLDNGTINNCYIEGGSISGVSLVGGLVGYNESGTINNCYSTAIVSGNSSVGGLVGFNWDGSITNSYATGSVSGNSEVGGLVGYNVYWAFEGTITNCYSTASVTGGSFVGGLVGENSGGTIANCYVEGGSVSGNDNVGGLAGSSHGTISNSYATGSVSGNDNVGGLVGVNLETITNSYATGSVSGNDNVGGLVGYYYGTITNCYSIGNVTGTTDVGGLLGRNAYFSQVIHSFWDIETSGQTTSAGGTGLPTAEMQMASTFTDAGWDFTTPVWTIDEGVDYLRLWWEMAPILHAEPEVTLGTSNIITWHPVPGANEYYAECAEDANFTSIIYSTGWINETSCEFTDLKTGQKYWYSVKARNSVATETGWSNVESSLQGTLANAVEATLEPENLKNENMKNALLSKIDAALKMIEEGLYEEALNKLRNDILQKTNGCALTGEPDKNDWIIICEQQSQIYPLIIETIEYLRSLME